MLRDLAPERATAPATDDPPPATGLVVAAAAVRGAVVAIAGVLLTAGLALMVWAITPASGPDAAVAMRGGVTAFALANLMPVDIGDVTLSLPPLLLTAVPVTLLVLTARRGRFLPSGRYQESIAVLTTAGVYGLVVAATTRGYSTPGAVPPGWVWTAFALALVATGLGMLRGDSAWSQWLLRALPGWARAGVRGGVIGSCALVGAGALVLAIGLIARFGTAVDIAAAAAPSWLDGLGMTLLGLAYLPNAVVAAVGFLSGVGFEVGPGTYSPLATSTVDLPGVPLLAAAPQQSGRTILGLACLVLPLAVGYLAARPAVRRLVTRADRVAAAGLAGVLAGTVLALAALVAGGGVGDGRWSPLGSPADLLGPPNAVEVAAVACVVAAVTGWRTVPWRVRDLTTAPDAVDSTGDAPATTDPPPADGATVSVRGRRTRRGSRTAERSAGERSPARRRRGRATADQAGAGEAGTDATSDAGRTAPSQAAGSEAEAEAEAGVEAVSDETAPDTGASSETVTDADADADADADPPAGVEASSGTAADADAASEAAAGESPETAETDGGTGEQGTDQDRTPRSGPTART
ncbi:DUF6350 family protein [Nakamurella sp.]|uniref:cell division protein PerM n=1 Tax=Nakamurella sp. TaxID=1869182 RepID=UPI003B3B7943